METHKASQPVEEYFPGNALGCTQEGNRFEFITDNGVTLRLEFVDPSIVRFRFNTENRFPNDFSYAIDPAFKGQKVDAKLVEMGDAYAIQTEDLSIRISKAELRTTITDRKDGFVICDDEKGFHWQDHKEAGGEIVKMSKKAQPGEHYFGLGDKSGLLNLRGQRLSLWGSDTYGYGPADDPLYKNIPFYLSIRQRRSYGIFFDNSFESTFDFGKERPVATSFFAQGGEMNYYFIHGRKAEEVVARYTKLTGPPEMPPLWALGYHQCKWSYYPEAKVKAIADGFRSRKIPCDAIYLDIDYMDGYRCFTWDAERFPDPKKMVGELEDDGFKVVAIIDPGLKIDPNYSVWKDGYDRGFYCRRQDGPLFKGSVWPGLCHFPDFTKPEVRDWWADQFKGLIEDVGIRGIWNDMNEPAVFEEGTFPKDVRHDYDGNPCSHRKAHNVYGMQMVRATQEGLRRFGGDRRPFAITRSGYSGVQRFACGWTGDNIASWEHLKIANLQCQRLATSGMSFIGSDVGGFIEDPTPELYARWVQMAVFHPFFRTHSSGDHAEQEPWSYDKKTTDMVRKSIELRYQLLPYLYTSFHQHVTTGTPILKSIAIVADQDPDAYWRGAEFGFGEHLIVVPIHHPGEGGRYLYLPNEPMVSFYDGVAPKAVGKDIWVDSPDDRIPLFVRSGAIIPMWPLQQYVGEIENPEPTLHVFHTDEELDSHLYEDSGDGFGYREGDFRYSTLTQKGSDSSVEISRTWDGDFDPGYDKIHVALRNLPFEAATVTVDGKDVPLDTSGEHPGFSVPKNFVAIEIKG